MFGSFLSLSDCYKYSNILKREKYNKELYNDNFT